MEIWKLVSFSLSCSGIMPKLFLTTTLYTPLSLLMTGLNWSVVRPSSSLLYSVWAWPSGKALPFRYHVTVVFSRNRLWNSTVKVKGRLPLISWNGEGWEVMAGGTGGGREDREEGGWREEWGSTRVDKIGNGRGNREGGGGRIKRRRKKRQGERVRRKRRRKKRQGEWVRRKRKGGRRARRM